MNVSLTPELEKWVNEKVKSGRYNSRSELIREALRLLEDRERMREIKRQALRKEIQKGLESGPATPLDMESIKREARARWEAENKMEVKRWKEWSEISASITGITSKGRMRGK